MLPLSSLTLSFNMLNASFVRIEGSMVSRGSSGIVVACTGTLYTDRSSSVNLGGDEVLGETAGESSYRDRVISKVLCEPTDDSSGIAANVD
jgi:hypothetical protein